MGARNGYDGHTFVLSPRSLRHQKGAWRVCPSLQSEKERGGKGIQIARGFSAEGRKKISTSGFYGFYERQSSGLAQKGVLFFLSFFFFFKASSFILRAKV